GCHILVFEAASDPALQKAFRICEQKADKRIKLAGEDVLVFAEKRESDDWSYFVSRPQPGVLICATHEGYLEETLKRISRQSDRRAPPTDLPEWKHVDVKAQVWAIRHYQKESAENDPSSPLGGQGSANVPDPAAIGFVFVYSPDTESVARAV